MVQVGESVQGPGTRVLSSLLSTEGGTVPFHAFAPRQLVEHLAR